MSQSGKYRIRILPEEGCNPDFTPDAESREGYVCGAYMMILWDENGENPKATMMAGVSIKDLRDMIRKYPKEETIKAIRAAAVLAEADLQAMRIVG